ncbi:MAG: hypothetical protein AAFY59_18500, partial [Pseudomonadota bacterium]
MSGLFRAALLAGTLAGAAGCVPYSETVGAAAPLGTVWELEAVSDAPARARMTLVFLANGDVQGQLP